MKLKNIFIGMVIVLAIGAQEHLSRAADTLAATPKPAPESCEPALATTAAAAIFGLKAKKIILVDVRPAVRFAQYRIAGSLNIPLHAIKTKAFMKTKPVVLVNEGFVIGPLAETCRALNKAGFKATILAGGFMAWKQKGGHLIGDPFAQNRMNRITPRLLEQEKESTPLKMINVSAQQNLQIGHLIPDARTIAILKNDQNLAEVKKLIKAESSDPFARIVLFTATGKENDRIQRRLEQAGIHQAFFLDGGIQAYEKYLQQVQLARRPVGERKVSTGGCNTCARN